MADNFNHTPDSNDDLNSIPPIDPYGSPQSGPYGFDDDTPPYYAPGSQALPLIEAIKGLPGQYINAITKPSIAFFAKEQAKAAWNIVWFQLGLMTILPAFGLYITFAFGTLANADVLSVVGIRFSFVFLVLFPITFFIIIGIPHVIAKFLGGKGTLLAYCYNELLFDIPIWLLGLLFLCIPNVGNFMASFLSIYRIVLQVFMTMGVHRVKGLKAILSLLIVQTLVDGIIFVLYGLVVGLLIANA